MPRIVLISNRVTDLGSASQAGGVSVILANVIAKNSALWFGWNGVVLDEEGEPEHTTTLMDTLGSRIITSALSSAEYRDYYLGYSNSVLWPVFHNRLDLAQFEAGYFSRYMSVNRRFAAALQAVLLPDDIIWVHDYHLIPMAKELRALGVENPIGFFLHIPVPPAQSLLAIPEHIEIGHALAAYDLVGLQTRNDVYNLLDFFRQAVFGQLLSNGQVRVGNNHFNVASFPIGIDIADFAAENFDVDQNAAEPPEIRIIGIDRLDYTKGLPQKFRAYGRFLENNPQYSRKVVLSQIAPPTRETLEAYSDIRAELESLAGSINGKFGELDWVPIYYMHRAVDRRDLFEIYRASRVCLVTPLRDGMNLVAKEYVAAQNPQDPGVLVLSRFAGAAEQLEAAIIVNPYSVDEMAEAIKTAVEMPKAERIARHRTLMDVVSAQSSAEWTDVFLEALELVSADRRVLKSAAGSEDLLEVLDVLKRKLGDGLHRNSERAGSGGDAPKRQR